MADESVATLEQMLTEGVAAAIADTVAEASPTAYPWLASLKDTLTELTTCVQMCETLLQLHDSNKLPVVKLYVADPEASESPQVLHYIVPWTHMIERLQPAALENFFWNPVLNHLRDRIAKLTIDIGELNKFISDRFAPGLPK